MRELEAYTEEAKSSIDCESRGKCEVMAVECGRALVQLRAYFVRASLRVIS